MENAEDLFPALSPYFSLQQMTMDCCSTKLLKYHADQRKLERLLNVEVMMPSPRDPERFSFWVST